MSNLSERRTFSSSYPELAAQWHPFRNTSLDLTSIAPFSNKSAWWKCDLDHEWEAKISSRARGSNCPYCGGKKILSGFNDLSTSHPQLASQWHSSKNLPLKVSDISSGSAKKIWWQCDLGHEWEASPNNRSSNGTGCPKCAGHTSTQDGKSKTSSGINDLLTTHPEVSTYWHPTLNKLLQPSMVNAGSAQEIWWQCEQGHEWLAPVRSMAKKKSCSYCSGRSLLIGFNDLATTHPELTSQWHPTKNSHLSAYEVKAGSAREVWWKCDIGHEWEARISSRSSGNQCPVCANQKVVSGINDLMTTHPLLAAQWHTLKNKNLTSAQVVSGSAKIVWWLCEQNHEWESEVRGRIAGEGCPYCSGHRVLFGFNDLCTLRPLIAAQWHPLLNGTLMAHEVGIGSSQRAWWLCPKGHDWQVEVYHRTHLNSGTNCPECAKSFTVSRGEEELATWLRGLGLDVQTSVRSLIAPLEIDIYLPAYSLGIEYNGLYWHSEFAGKDRSYHKRKMEESRQAGITLFQVWEDDWRDRKEIVKKMLLHRLGMSQQISVPARKTQISMITKAETADFLMENHLQGPVMSSTNLGLRDADNTLVALAAFKRASPRTLNLERYATSCRVPGGFSRLLQYAIKTMNPEEIITFADLSVSEGNLYEATGFKAEKTLEPDYSYLVRGERVHKFNYRLNRFRQDQTLQYQAGLSERELAGLNGLPRIWDSGKIRYVYTV